MPLSKAKNKERMRKSRLHKRLLLPQFAMRLRERKLEQIRCCEVCGYSETVDKHHEGEEVHILCPNCHGLITRRIKTLGQLLPSQTSKPVQPNTEVDGELAVGFRKEAMALIDADGNPMPDYT